MLRFLQPYLQNKKEKQARTRKKKWNENIPYKLYSRKVIKRIVDTCNRKRYNKEKWERRKTHTLKRRDKIEKNEDTFRVVHVHY